MALQVLNRYGANFSFKPHRRPKSRNNWRGSGRKSDLQYRRLVQRRCVNRLLATGPKARSELVKGLQTDTDLKQAGVYRYLASLLKQRYLTLEKQTKLIYLTTSWLSSLDLDSSLASPSNSNQNRNANSVQSESDAVTVTWTSEGKPVLTIERPCLHCGNEVQGRKSKRYCSNNCRQRAFHMKQAKTKPEWDGRLSALENVNRMFSKDTKEREAAKRANAEYRRNKEAREADRREQRKPHWNTYLRGEVGSAEYCRRVPMKEEQHA